MSRTSKPTGPGPHSDMAADAWIGRRADDIPPGWMDHMIRRLFDQWNRQMIKFDDLKNGSDRSTDAASRADDARSLAQLQRSLAQLIKLETTRAVLRSTKAIADHDETRAAFMRRMGDLLAAAGAREIPEESDE